MSASNRLEILASHLQPCDAAAARVTSSPSQPKHDYDIVIVSALRTPICKAKKGAFKNTLPDDLLAAVIKATVERSKIKPDLIGDIVVGNVLQPGAGGLIARFAQFYAGIPETTPLMTVNRQCSSGLQAFVNVANAIQAGVCDVGLAGGVESMSSADMSSAAPSVMNPKVGEFELAGDCLIPMGITSENVAERFGVSRREQDEFAAASHAKAVKAQKDGLFREEIVSVTTTVTDGNTERTIVVDSDDGIRAETTVASLAKLKPAFTENGSTTAGNSSQVSDGAAAVLLMKRSTAKHLNLPILGRFLSYGVVGVKPDVMGIGPAYAIPEALSKAKLSISDIDVFEINEAFASQAVYCVKKLGIPIEKVNPKGGAIAIGHPLGCTGARQIATLLHELRRRRQHYGVVSMCIGTGMGAAAVFEAEF